MIENLADEIFHAVNSIEAVEACRNNPDIDLVLMDINMSGMDGYEATRQIRMFNKEVIIIAQTAYALSIDREKALAAGCNDYISKPVSRKALQLMINKYFN
jgi:CheY-like chemotaxis protein